ncbi:amino acid adenylation domain-containing protein [Streptomyces sp. NPDC005474]|uniref:amino acid adenylation domain-containing protein n=1 Tax=Streptomyces sp. NPDC005474 TaxID=3154878 RepID=UPI00345135AA
MADRDTESCLLVTNAAGDFGIWPAHQALPAGWHDAGHRGTRASCSAEADHRAKGQVPLPDLSDGTQGTLLELFDRTVGQHPDRPAVRDDYERLTYAQLSSATDAFARTLAERGITSGDRVAYLLPRAAKLYVVMLGILKAGGAYVPLDPGAPDERTNLLIARSGTRLVVTEPGWRDRLSLPESVAVLEYDGAGDCDSADRSALSGSSGAAVGPDHPAAVLFTSGSTGLPKPVRLDHRNLVHLAGNAGLPRITPDDRIGHVSNVAFDAFHWETWCAFAAGAEIAVLPTMPDLLNDDIGRELKRRKISAMLVPTMAFNHLAQELPEVFAGLRLITTGGDILSPRACGSLFRSGFAGRLFNLYGPTEGTTACSAYEVTPDDAAADDVPIGRALDGVRLSVRDGNGVEAPVGAAGELHIGGPTVSRGYLGEPALTAERFLPDPENPGGRLYATGDLVERGEDGLLRYRGRADDQVKIRGYRVEPREVEKVLGRHPQVADVAVTVSQRDGGDRTLFALVVAFADVSLRDLREFAEQSLPAYMVPSSFIRLSEIPANDRGKRDGEQLRTIVEEHLRAKSQQVKPVDPLEVQIAELWKEILSLEEVGRTDDFFHIGGDSLQALRLRRRIHKVVGVEISNREILVTSELRSLADLVRSKQEGSMV